MRRPTRPVIYSCAICAVVSLLQALCFLVVLRLDGSAPVSYDDSLSSSSEQCISQFHNEICGGVSGLSCGSCSKLSFCESRNVMLNSESNGDFYFSLPCFPQNLSTHDPPIPSFRNSHFDSQLLCSSSNRVSDPSIFVSSLHATNSIDDASSKDFLICPSSTLLSHMTALFQLFRIKAIESNSMFKVSFLFLPSHSLEKQFWMFLMASRIFLVL